MEEEEAAAEPDEVAPTVDPAIKLAFDLPMETGADLLLRLGSYDVWRGNLAFMRDDPPTLAPHAEPAAPPTSEDMERADLLYKATLLRRARRYLQPRCEMALELWYVAGHDAEFIARQLETTVRYAEKLVHNCRHRMYEIARNLGVDHLPGSPPSDGTPDRSEQREQNELPEPNRKLIG